MSEKILVVAAHPDDEIIGCGGTMARHIGEGDRVRVIIVSEGETSRLEKDMSEVAQRKTVELAECALRASKLIGVEELKLLRFPDNRLDSIDRLDLIKAIEKEISSYEPDCIYTHHFSDVNIDHRRIHEACLTACRPTPNNKLKRMLLFEIASSTEWQEPMMSDQFKANWFVDIEKYWEIKKRALVMYQSEMRDWPHPRSIRAIEQLNRWRGAQTGNEIAEAFSLTRNIIR